MRSVATDVSLTKTDEPVHMSFGGGGRLDHLLDGGTRWHHLANTVDRSVRRHRCVYRFLLLQQFVSFSFQMVLRCNGRFIGEPVLASFSLVFYLQLFRKRISEDK